MSKIVATGLFLGLLGIQTVTGSNATESVETLLASIFESARTVNTIESDFMQIREVSLLAQPIISTGRFYFQKSDALRWEVVSPDPMGFWVKGANGKRWKEDEDRFQKFAVSSVPFIDLFTKQVFAWTNGNLDLLTTHYRMAVVEKCPLTLKLVPIKEDEKQYLAYVQLLFSDNLDHIQDVLIQLMDGDQTRISFSNTVLNKPFPNDLFE